MYYFTSITTNYIPKARILCKSLKKKNSKAVFILCLCDKIPDSFNIADEEFDGILTLDDIKEIKNKDIYRFKHNITELCTAVKPLVAKQILIDFNTEKVVYLDPDIVVFSSLDNLEDMLDSYSMVFTPHQTVYETEDSFVRSNEILFLKRGTMNLGFFFLLNDQ